MRTAVASVGLVGIVAAVTVAAIDTGQDRGGRPTARADRQVLSAVLAERPPGAAYFHPYTRLSEFLPNVGHVSDADPNGAPFRVTDNVARGQVVEVVEDRGFVQGAFASTKGRPGPKPTSYDDAAADWRSLRVEVQVTEVLAGANTSRLTFYLALMGNSVDGEDGGAVKRALRDLGEIVIFSRANPGSPEYLGLTRQLPDEPFGLATVNQSGEIAFPFAGQDGEPSSKDFLAGTDTLEKLRAEARRPPRNKKN